MAKPNACRVVCNYHKERRPFTAKDAGRVICYAIRDGAELSEIMEESFIKCGVVVDPCEEARDRLEQLARGLEIAIEVAAVALPALAAARRYYRATKAAGWRAGERDIGKVENLMENADRLARENLARTKELLDKMQREGQIIIREP